VIFDGGGSEHEEVVFCQDRRTGLRCIIAIYSTALGPSLGGTRFYPFPSEDTALTDVLNLSRAMAYKNAMAGLDHGGGKAVIIGDPTTDKTPELLRAYGRFVQSLGGRYITACDVGTYVADMDVVAEVCDYVTGRSEAAGGAGDSSVLTAFGVYRAMLAAATFRWSAGGLDGRRLGVIGIGKVGRHLIDLAAADGATILATDVNPVALDWARRNHPDVELLDDDEEVTAADLDILAPCALGGSITDDNVDAIRAAVICGAANNQLAHDGLDNRLLERGILYCPDFVVNSGGVIQVADELHGFDFERAKAKTTQIYDTTIEVLELAASKGVTPTEAATHLADERMAASQSARHTSPSGRASSANVE
jgi:valine dehydrogenase (NAD+)